MDTVELTYINHPEQLIYDLASESNRKQQGHAHMATPSPQNRNRHSVYLQQQFIFKITFYSDGITSFFQLNEKKLVMKDFDAEHLI